MSCLRVSLIAWMAGLLAYGGWERRVSIELGSWIDAPVPHPLAYFKANACPGRAPQERLRTCDFRTRTELKPIGRAGPYAVFDLDYFDLGDRTWQAADSPLAKSILVQVATGSFERFTTAQSRRWGRKSSQPLSKGSILN